MQLRKGFKLWWLLIPIILGDQITKHLARQLTRVVNVVPGVLSWELTCNRGAAFSMLSGKGALLAAVTVILIIMLLFYQLCHAENSSIERIGLWCIIGGGIGNLIDRAAFGGVTDFIRLDFVRFAIFNVADIFVCLGAFLVILATLTAEFRRKKHG